MNAGMLLVALGCRSDDQVVQVDLDLRVDERYRHSVDFSALAVSVPIRDPHTFARVDPLVDDLVPYQAALVAELGLTDATFRYSDPAKNGRSFALRFRDGAVASFSFARAQPDRRIAESALDHERYHAVCRVEPDERALVWDGLREHGFDVAWEGLDEETAASVIEIASLHARGVALEDIGGSSHVGEALDILRDAAR